MRGRFLPVGLEKRVPSRYSSLPDKEDKKKTSRLPWKTV